MDHWIRAEGTVNVQDEQQMPLTSSNIDGTEETPVDFKNDFGAISSRARRTPTQRLLGFATIAISFCAGVLFTGAILAATATLSTNSLQKLNDARLPHIASGTDDRTGQPASWFNGNCGSSAQEARSRDCVFDLVSHSWLPKDCLFDEDIEDADLMYANNTWHWGLDDMKEVSWGEVRKGGFDRVWTSMDWHVTHCSFLSKRLHRALLDPGRKLDSYTADYHHTSHCTDMIAGLSPVEPVNGTGTRVYTKFPTCS